MKIANLILISALLIVGCNQSPTSENESTELSIDSIEVSNQDKVELPTADIEPDKTSLQLLSTLLSDHKFEESRKFIELRSIDLNDFLEVDKARQFIYAKRLLPELTHIYCDSAITKFLLSQELNPNLPSITISIPEYSGEVIPEGFDVRNDDLSNYVNQNYLVKDFPLQISLSCDDSTSFYLLVNAGANQDNAILEGAIKWSDILLIKEMVAKGVPVNTVPRNHKSEILKLLTPITDGKQYGEVEYGEGGDMFETDLMNASYDGKKELVSFMLETGADPNNCLPSNISMDENGNPIGIDENGYYPAVTALSIARKEYDKNIELSENREDADMFIARAKDYMEIIKLLQQYGAKDISKCMGP